MPLYEYSCQECHRHTEKRQKFSDPEITECPHCGGHLERVISAPNIAFKGGGWYKDLYSSPKPASASEGKGEAKSEGKSEAGTVSDSAPKPVSSGNEASGSAPASTPPATTSAPAAAATKS